jgi:hypothetical protein
MTGAEAPGYGGRIVVSLQLHDFDYGRLECGF